MPLIADLCELLKIAFHALYPDTIDAEKEEPLGNMCQNVSCNSQVKSARIDYALISTNNAPHKCMDVALPNISFIYNQIL